jgi:selenide,water dikinase
LIDREKRKLIMGRSMLLGHCVCDPKKPCPCELFKAKNVCLCAGERLEESPAQTVRLTKLVEKAGCASKIDQAFLKNVLHGLPFPNNPQVLVGAPAGDDAGVFKLNDQIALVQTVDVFTPSVDDPYTFGQVAAANSVSDVYAMGGKPITALSVIGFPSRELNDCIMRDIIRGGLDKMAEAGVAVIGGHSINDAQIKAGFAVTGLISPDRIISNAGARAGDVLILTKPLGTGIIAFAAQIDRAGTESVQATARSMAALNRTASELMLKSGVHACTDVTGFGLMGHLTEMAASSGVDIEIAFGKIPLFPGVLEAARADIIPGAVERNKESCGSRVSAGKGVTQQMADICFDAQTSGGLLICIPEAEGPLLLKKLRENGISQAGIIGKVRGAGSGQVFIEAQ